MHAKVRHSSSNQQVQSTKETATYTNEIRENGADASIAAVHGSVSKHQEKPLLYAEIITISFREPPLGTTARRGKRFLNL
jgi:hypothetical protein